VKLQRPAAGRLAVQPGQEQQAGWLDEIGGGRLEAGAGIIVGASAGGFPDAFRSGVQRVDE
jgi:hypothetical protein